MVLDLKATLPNGAKRLQQKFNVTLKELIVHLPSTFYLLVSLLIGARTLKQSLSEVIINQSNSLITFDTELKTTLTLNLLMVLPVAPPPP